MIKRNRLSVAVCTAIGLTGTAFLPSQAVAQGEQVLEEVVVTGSRIARNPETYIGAMAITTSEDIERNVNNSVMDALLRIPSITNSNATGRNNSNNSSRGANFVEIHNLEPERTLVLMNGRRVVSTIRDSRPRSASSKFRAITCVLVSNERVSPSSLIADALGMPSLPRGSEPSVV